MPEQQTRQSGLELITEVAGLAVCAGMITFTVFPLALPALALTALAALLLLVPALIGAVLAAPILMLRRWGQSRDRDLTAARPADSGGSEITPPLAGAQASRHGRTYSTSVR